MSTVPLDKADKWFAALEPRLQNAALQGLRSAALRGVQDIVARIIPSRIPAPVDRGVYRAGWNAHSVTRQGNKVFIQNREPIAPLIEYGVRARKVKIGARMLTALAEWAMRKGLAKNPKEAKQVAWAIAQNMRKKGIFNRNKPGLGILKELMDTRMKQFIKEEVGYALKQEMAKNV